MEPIQNEGQQTVDNITLIVASQLHIEGDEYFYKLLRKDAVDAKREERRKLHLALGKKEDKFEEFSDEDERVNEYYLLAVEVLVLAPGIEAKVEGDISKTPYKSILSSARKIDHDNDSIEYKYSTFDDDYDIWYPSEITELNEKLYGSIKDVKATNPRSSLHFKHISGAEYYEVKLLKALFIGGKNYRNVYLPSKGLLKGFSVKKFTLNPVSLFQEYFSKKDEKLILIANFAEKETVLYEEDLRLFEKANFYKRVLYWYGWIIAPLTLLILYINAIIGIDYGKNFPLWLTTFSIIMLTWSVYKSMYDKINKLEPKIKDDLLEYKKIANIKALIFWAISLMFTLYSFSRIYTYNSPYVYDTKTKTLIEKSYFYVDNNEIFSPKKISERYSHVYDKFTGNVFYKNKNEKVTADTQFLAIDLVVKCSYGKHLVDIEPSIAKASIRLQNDISAGKFGNWDKENILEDSDFQKSLVDVRKTLCFYIVDEYTESHDVSTDFITSITVTPRYTKLQGFWGFSTASLWLCGFYFAKNRKIYKIMQNKFN